jgi:hypothetical protein
MVMDNTTQQCLNFFKSPEQEEAILEVFLTLNSMPFSVF